MGKVIPNAGKRVFIDDNVKGVLPLLGTTGAKP
jgi:hypothetical protein